MKTVITLFCLLLFIQTCTDEKKLEQGDFAINLDNLNIEFTVRGKGPIMFAGHLYSGKTAYELTLKPLEAYFTMVYYSPRGTGNSEAPKTLDQYSYKFIVNEVELLRQYLGVERIWIFGHSDQSLVAMQYAIDHPDHIEGLILSGTHYIEPPEIEYLKKKEFENQRKTEQQWFKQICQDLDYKIRNQTNIDSLGRDLTYSSLKWWCYDSVTSEKVIPIYNEINKVGRRKNVQGGQPFTSDTELAEYTERLYKYQKRYKEIKARTLILQGAKDTNNPPTLTEKLKEEIPNSSLVFIDKAGHFPWVEQAEKSFQEIIRWLEE